MKSLLLSVLLCVVATHNVCAASKPLVEKSRISEFVLKISKTNSLAILFDRKNPLGYIHLSFPDSKDLHLTVTTPADFHYTVGVEMNPSESDLAWVVVYKDLRFIDCVVVSKNKNFRFAPKEIIEIQRKRAKDAAEATEKFLNSIK